MNQASARAFFISKTAVLLPSEIVTTLAFFRVILSMISFSSSNLRYFDLIFTLYFMMCLALPIKRSTRHQISIDNRMC